MLRTTGIAPGGLFTLVMVIELIGNDFYHILVKTIQCSIIVLFKLDIINYFDSN